MYRLVVADRAWWRVLRDGGVPCGVRPRRGPAADTGALRTHAPRQVRISLMGLLQLRYEHDSSTIRLRFDYDSSAIQHPTRSYVLSSNNEHVNSLPLL